MREFLIEVQHGRDECSIARAGLADGRGRRSYWGCDAGTHTTWIIAELAASEEGWRLVPALLRDTARVVPVERFEPGVDHDTTTERRSR